ncbi:hypothetical protein ABE042_21925 [Viridibacillus arvi]|uniref:hypothetical protein n=1 Tax=Viridibacillus arvi TaxID=263475 RepID=UPI003D26E3DF
MAELKVITTKSKKTPNYKKIYTDAFINQVKKVDSNSTAGDFKDIAIDLRSRIIWAGVKMTNCGSMDGGDLAYITNKFHLIGSIKDMLGTLTPREFQTIFPIEKEYNGEKNQTKDYFYTRKFIEEFGLDKVIDSGVDNFLWEYQNWDINIFLLELMSITSKVYREQTGKGLMEKFCEENNIPTYTIYEDSEGMKHVHDNQTGEVSKLKKPCPRYLRVVD